MLTDAGLITRHPETARSPVHLDPQVLDLLTGWINRHQRAAEVRFRRLDAVLTAMDDRSTPPTASAPSGAQEGTPS